MCFNEWRSRRTNRSQTNRRFLSCIFLSSFSLSPHHNIFHLIFFTSLQLCKNVNPPPSLFLRSPKGTHEIILRRTEKKEGEVEEVSFLVQMSLSAQENVLRKTLVISSDTDISTLLKVFFFFFFFFFSPFFCVQNY